MENRIIWLTGLPCSGKTTIAMKLARHLDAEVLDGDDIRNIMKNTDFSPEGREKHMLAVAEMAYRFSKYTHVIVSLVSPLRDVREKIKEKYPNVKEVYVNCDVEVCKKRDVKGMYAKALAGEIKNFTGIDAPYEAPESNYQMIRTDIKNVEECVKDILDFTLDLRRTYCMFIGRYQPLHDGHKKLMQKKIDEGKDVLVALRNTGINDSNPYSSDERRKMFKEAFGDKVKVIAIPDIEGVFYGRGVGYKIEQINLDAETEKISATKIRESM